MFLGGLSSEAERKARRKREDNNSSLFKSLPVQAIFDMMDLNQADADLAGIKLAAGASEGEIPARRSAADRVPLVFSEPNEPSKELTIQYFETCIRMILDDKNVDEIVKDSASKNVPLHMAAMEYQRDILEYNIGIERNFGCKYLSRVSQVHDDPYISELAQTFIYAALKSYIKQLRSRAQSAYLKAKLRTEGGISRNSILEFFEGCNALSKSNVN